MSNSTHFQQSPRRSKQHLRGGLHVVLAHDHHQRSRTLGTAHQPACNMAEVAAFYASA